MNAFSLQTTRISLSLSLNAPTVIDDLQPPGYLDFDQIYQGSRKILNCSEVAPDVIFVGLLEFINN